MQLVKHPSVVLIHSSITLVTMVTIVNFTCFQMYDPLFIKHGHWDDILQLLCAASFSTSAGTSLDTL